MEHKQVIVVRKDLNMRKGKIAAQAAHASMAAILNQATNTGNSLVIDLTDQRLEPWLTGRFKKICVYVTSEEELLNLHNTAQAAGMISSLILDSGLTEFGGVKTYTTVAIGPDVEDKVNAITGHLPLL